MLIVQVTTLKAGDRVQFNGRPQEVKSVLAVRGTTKIAVVLEGGRYEFSRDDRVEVVPNV